MPSVREERSLNILIVEDDDDSRESLTDILEMVGYRVSSVSNARDAFSHAILPEADVILMDRQLPDGMAEQHVTKIAELAPNADVIIVTGYADLAGTIAAFREGVSDYIIKPLDPDTLLKRLKRLEELRQAERELRAERTFATNVLETAEAIVVVLNRDGHVERCNRYFAEMVGYSMEELVGIDWFDTFIPKREQSRIHEVFQETVSDSDTSGVVNPIVTKSGVERAIRWSNTTMKSDDGTVTGVLAVGLDITDLVHTQKELLQSERLATIGQTMTGLAHESRNALQRLQNGVELLRDDLFENKSAMRDLDKIERASNDLRDLLEEVRSYAAPIRLELFDVSLSDIWKGAWSDVETRRSSRDIRLIEPADGGDIRLTLDMRRMRQVFVNLFENALDACADPVEISIAVDVLDDEIVLRLQDNGPGMPPEVIAKVFDAFFTTKPTGTGLGLAIVYRIIEAHGGRLSVDSDEQGTRFEITLPRNNQIPN